MVDYFRMVRRHIAEHLLQALADIPVALVNGARQTGKSTLVQSAELIEQGRQYLTFDDPGVLGAAKLDPNGFIAGLTARSPSMKCSMFPSYFRQSKLPLTEDGNRVGFCSRVRQTLCSCLSYPSPWPAVLRF
jgi:hypothetical protein